MAAEKMSGRPTPFTDQIRREHEIVLDEIKNDVVMRDSTLPSMILAARAFDAARAKPTAPTVRKPSNFDKPNRKPTLNSLLS